MCASTFPEGQRIVFTGRLASMSRDVALEKITARGGIVRSNVTSRTDTLVIGADGWPLRSTGQLTLNLERADDIMRQGGHIAVIGEAEFLRQLTDEQPTCVMRTHSLEQLSRLIGISGLRVRRWITQGLIRPIASSATVPQFDYREVRAAKTLSTLIRRGIRPATLVQSLKRLSRWLPDDAVVAEHLVMLQRQLLVRDEAGNLLEASGQFHFDFDAGDDDLSATVEVSTTIALSDSDALYDSAFQSECDGRLDDAIYAYNRWLDCFVNDADVCFNLANVYVANEMPEQAVLTYRRCLNIDPEHDEAWNNLGLCLAQMGNYSEAVKALRKAVGFAPKNADWCYNLADLLDQAGSDVEAR